MLENKQSSFPNLLREYSADFDSAQPLRKVILSKDATGGLEVVGGDEGEGVFVSSAVTDGDTDIQRGDKFLKINGKDVSSAREAEVQDLLTMAEGDIVEIICQNRLEDLQEVEDKQLDGQDGSRHISHDSSPSKRGDGSKRGGKKSRSPTRSSGKKRSASDGSDRMSGRGHRRQSDAERYEEVSARWDQAKQEVRAEDTETLREKIALQQELIRKQDEVAEQRKLHMHMLHEQVYTRGNHIQAECEQRLTTDDTDTDEVEEDVQKREEERTKKQAKEAELRRICQESLEEDRKQKQETRAKQRAEKKTTKKNEPVTSTPSPTKSPTSPTTQARGRRSSPFKMTLPAMSATPDLPDGDDEGETPEPAFTVPKDVPWHEQQLYHLYGKNADYFLHPKIEAKAQVKKANPKLRRQGGRAGAEILWQTLRHDSQLRLMQEDASIPNRLKAAYGAFARQSLKKTNLPVRRMFCVDDDLPELGRLLDQRRVQKIHRSRHKADLMYRASVANQDRTEVLKFNNPLPDFNSRAESINQYLPSWQDDMSVKRLLPDFNSRAQSVNQYLPSWLNDMSDESIPEYMRWIPARGQFGREGTIQEEEDYDEYARDQGSPQKPAYHMAQSVDDDLMLIMARRRPAQNKQKYHFLTEKETEVKGTFTDRYQDDRDYKDLPRPYDGAAPKCVSAMGGMMSASPDKSPAASSLRYSAPLPYRHSQALQNNSSIWEPLSMTALVEYKKQVNTEGQGDFNLGRAKMWSNIPVV